MGFFSNFFAPAAGAKPTVKTQAVTAAQTGAVYTVTPQLDPAATLSLTAASSSNLTINASTGVISATAALGAGVSQIAYVREVLGSGSAQVAEEYAVTIVSPALAPAAPLLIASPGNAQITFSLADGATNGSAITSRTLYVGSASGGETAIGPVTFPYTLTGLTNGTPVYAQATTTNGVGESNRSAEISATPTAANALLLEDGTYLLAEDNSHILTEA